MILPRAPLAPFLAFLAILIVGFTLLKTDKRTPAPAEIIPPEQSHYAIFSFTCGVLQFILMTTEPPLIATAEEPASSEMLDLLKATPPEQIIEFWYVGPECNYTESYRAPSESIDE